MKTWKTGRGIEIIRLLSGRSNVFFVNAGNIRILYDSCSRHYQNSLINNLMKLNPSGINALVISHAHFDHAGNAAWIRENTGAKTIIHSLEAKYLEKGENAPIKGSVFLTRWLINMTGRDITARLNYPPCKADVQVAASRSIPFPGQDVFLLHTPGHTSGMLSMVIDHEIALVGDTLFGIFPGSVFPPFAEDTRQLIKSWEILLESGCTCFFPSHGRPISRKMLEKSYLKRIGTSSAGPRSS